MFVVRAAVAAVVLVTTAANDAGANECHVVDVSFQPAEIANAELRTMPAQIVAWIEDASGTYVDTVFITQQTGSFGLGNRPGRFDFNSGPLWPYGVFPS
jgi:hypothetical protein